MLYCFRAITIAMFLVIVSNANGQTTPAKKQVSSVDVNRTKNQVVVTYTDGSSETMTEQDANKKGLVHNGGYLNSKDSSYKRISGQVQSGNTKPLVVVDGKEASNDTLSKIKPDEIESMNVLKGKAAIDKYGVKGKNGVVEVALKKHQIKNENNHAIDYSSSYELRKFINAKENDVIVSFTVIRQTIEEEIAKVDVIGDDFNPAARRVISLMKSGDTLIIEKIVVKRDGVVTKLPAVTQTFK